MSSVCWKVRGRAFLRTGLIVLMVEALTVPPGLTAAGITWNGGAGNYSSLNWTCPACGAPTYPNNGNLGLTFDAAINSGSGDTVNLDVASAVVDSMILGGSGPAASSTLNIANGGNLTFGTPSVTSGNVLTVSNGGVLNIANGGATLELSGGAGALNDVAGQIFVRDGGTLTIANVNAGGASTFVNNGNLNVAGTSGAASLILNGGSGSSFTLSGTGSLALSGTGQITGQTGGESLINDVGHTIAGDGVISGVANLTNNGTLHASTSGSALIAGGNLTNWDSATSTLTGGTYVVDNGSTLQLSSIGAGNAIQNLSGASAVTLNGTGVLSGGGGTNALMGLANVTDSNLIVNGGNFALGHALVVSAGDTPSGDGIAQLQLNSSSANIAGDLTNTATSFASNPASTVTLSGGSSLTVNNLNNGANLTNLVALRGAPLALVSLEGGSTLAVNGNLTNITFNDNQFGSGAPNSTINLDGGSSLNVSGTFTSRADFGGSLALLNLNNGSTATVAGLYSSTNGTITLQNGSRLAVGGALVNFSNGPFDEFNGFALLRLDSSSNAVIGGDLTNITTALSGGDASSVVSLGGGSSLTVQNLTNESDPGPVGDANALINVTGGSSLTVKGNVNNFFSEGAIGKAEISLDGGSRMTVSGIFTNQSASLSLTHNSTATVAGDFNNVFTFFVLPAVSVDSGSSLIVGGAFTNVFSGVDLDLSNSGKVNVAGLFTNNVGALVNLDVTGNGFSTLTTNGGFSNAGAVTLNSHSTLANTGTFSNSGTVDLFSNSNLTVNGLLDNNGGTLTVHGGSAVNVTGDIFNTSPGVVNLNGPGDTITATGQFVNSGVISFSGTNETVSSTGDFTNDPSGMITVSGAGNALSTQGNLANAGLITIDSGGSVTANTYTQTSGTTALNTGGVLNAALVDLKGGTLSGGGTINGDLVNEGGTLSPGDPQTTTITGNYDQTLLGILDLDFASASSYDHVTVGGKATLGGTLALTLESGFTASLGTLFNIMSWSTETGDFATFNAPIFNNGTLTFQEVFNAGHLDLQVVSTSVSATPEPATFGMALCAMLLGAGVRWKVTRRRRYPHAV